MTLKDLPSATSSPVSEGGQLLSGKQDGQTIDLFGQGAAPVTNASEDVREASSKCPICGHDKPHWHDKDEWEKYQVHRYYFEELYIHTAMREYALKSFNGWGLFPKNEWADVGNGAPLLKNPLQHACWKFFLGAIKLVEDKGLAALKQRQPESVTIDTLLRDVGYRDTAVEDVLLAIAIAYPNGLRIVPDNAREEV